MQRTQPISQVEIETEILRLTEILEAETEAFETLSHDGAKKEARHKMDWAKAYLAADGAVKERESWADYQTGDSLQDYKIAEALVRSKREKLHSTRTALDSLRTLAANVRAQT